MKKGCDPCIRRKSGGAGSCMERRLYGWNTYVSDSIEITSSFADLSGFRLVTGDQFFSELFFVEPVERTDRAVDYRRVRCSWVRFWLFVASADLGTPIPQATSGPRRRIQAGAVCYVCSPPIPPPGSGRGTGSRSLRRRSAATLGVGDICGRGCDFRHGSAVQQWLRRKTRHLCDPAGTADPTHRSSKAGNGDAGA